MPSPSSGVASAPMTDRLATSRYRRILRFAARHLLETWWFELALPRLGLGRLSTRTRRRRMQRVAREFHGLAVDLGGLMIKLGQFLSTRLDVLPPEITRELEGLQDEVPAVEFAAIERLTEAELAVPLSHAFAAFDPVPIAAASLGQVHRATLNAADAEWFGVAEVVVKVQRPGIASIVEVDLRALRRVAGWLNRIRLVNRRANAPLILEEFAETCRQEIDYLNEAANGEHFAEFFADNPRVRVPRTVWERTTRRVLTQEDVTAIKINDLEGLRAAGIDPAVVANEFAAIMFDQVLLGGFFHADPHPGNMFVEPLPQATPGDPPWRITFIDFGMMGEVSPSLIRALRSTFIAAASRDGVGMVNGMRDIGVLLPSADTVELERAMTRLFDRFGGMGFAELQRIDPREFIAFGREFGDLVRALPFQFPENFLLVLRALSLTSGMCSTLNPEFNIWNAVEPYSAKLVRAEGGNVLQAFARDALASARTLAQLPRRIDGLISRAELGQLSVRTPELERRSAAIERAVRRVVSAVLFAGLFLGGVVLADRDGVVGGWLIAVSALPLLHALFAGWWDRGNR